MLDQVGNQNSHDAAHLNFADYDTDDAESPKKKSRKKLIYPFTDDTAMARSVARSLIANKELDARDMARRYIKKQSPLFEIN